MTSQTPPQPELHQAEEPGMQPGEPHWHVPASASAESQGFTQTSALVHVQPGQQPTTNSLSHVSTPAQSGVVAHFFAQTAPFFPATHVAPSTQSAGFAHAPPTADPLLPQAATTAMALA